MILINRFTSDDSDDDGEICELQSQHCMLLVLTMCVQTKAKREQREAKTIKVFEVENRENDFFIKMMTTLTTMKISQS